MTATASGAAEQAVPDTTGLGSTEPDASLHETTQQVAPGDSAPKSHFFEDLDIGLSASVKRIVTMDGIQAFAEVSGDFNPVHMDPDYAAGTMFKQRIAHGILSASYVSSVFGMHLPGPGCIYISQTLNFKAPVHIGDEVITRVEVQELIPKRRRAIFACTCHVGETLVLDGEAVVMVPNRPE